jgi:prolyl 4-hydroxylase
VLLLNTYIVVLLKDIVVSKIEDRISLWSFLPKENGESIQVLKYGVNRSGSIKEEPKSSSGAHRLATILMYLSDVKQGGETVFPRSEVIISSPGLLFQNTLSE